MWSTLQKCWCLPALVTEKRISPAVCDGVLGGPWDFLWLKISLTCINQTTPPPRLCYSPLWNWMEMRRKMIFVWSRRSLREKPAIGLATCSPILKELDGAWGACLEFSSTAVLSSTLISSGLCRLLLCFFCATMADDSSRQRWGNVGFEDRNLPSGCSGVASLGEHHQSTGLQDWCWALLI